MNRINIRWETIAAPVISSHSHSVYVERKEMKFFEIVRGISYQSQPDGVVVDLKVKDLFKWFQEYFRVQLNWIVF